MNAKERLRKFVEYKGLGRNRFEETVGISSGYLSTKSPSLGSDIINKIARIYHDLNIEWLITGNGKMINTPYWNEIGTAERFAYKNLIYAPLVSRYAQAEYINRLNDKPYIDSLPTIPISADSQSKGGYMCFEMWNESMNDGSDCSYNVGDVLVCREIEHAAGRRKLCSNKPKSFVLVHKSKGIIAGQITAHDINDELISLHFPNLLFDDFHSSLNEVKKMFVILQLQRFVN